MKKIFSLVIVLILILSCLFYYIVNYSFLTRILQAEQKINNIESGVARLESGQKEILTNIAELKSKMIDFESSLSQVKDQNTYTQYLVERNGLDMKYFSKVITELEYYEQLVKLKTKYTTKKEKDETIRIGL